MIAGIAVQMTSSRCCRGSAGRRGPPRPAACGTSGRENTTITVTSTKTGTEAMIRTSQSVSIGPAWVEAAGGNQSISRPATMPIADATSPTTTICIAVRFGPCARPARPRAFLRALLLGHGSGILWVPRDGRQRGGARPARAARLRRRACRPARLRRRRAGEPDARRRRSAPLLAERRGRQPVVAAERLGELRGLAVADAVGDLADGQPAPGQQLGGALHAHRR